MDVSLLFATPLITLALHTGTGLLVLRRVRLNPSEKLIASMVVSGVLVYLGGFIGYLVNQPRLVSIIMLAISIVGLCASASSIRSLISNHQARRIIKLTLCLILWFLVIASVIRSYNGALWYGDWFEHYERTQLFSRVNEIDVNHKFLDEMYVMPARPPLQNVVTAVAIAPLGTRFDSYMWAMTTLNGLIAPAGMLLLSTIARRGQRAIFIYAALLAISPMVLQNATFAWTKLYAGFYALAGLYFYLRYFNKPRQSFLILSAISFAAGTMVHYSIVPYVLVLAVPFVLKCLRGPKVMLRHAMAGAIPALMLILTWVLFSFHHFGVDGTIRSNTSITDSSQLTFHDNLMKMCRNLFDTFVPMWPQSPSLAPGSLGYWRDRFFVLYQTTFPLLFGSAGFIILISRRFWKCAKPSSGFWVYYVFTVATLGVIVHGSPAMFGGLAHVALTPLAVHGLGWIAVVISQLRGPLWRQFITLGYLFDAALGVWIHFVLQSRAIAVAQGSIVPDKPDVNLTKAAYYNLALKERFELIFPYDHWPMLRWPILIFMALTLVLIICFLRRRLRLD